MKTKLLLFTVVLALFARGAGFAQTVAEWNDKGVQYYNQGDYARAIDCFLEAKNILEKTLGKNHPDYATSLNNLGISYLNTGNYAQAERHHLEALSIREKTLGKDHPSYATSLNSLGELYRSMGNYARAERYHLEALSIRERALGKEHPSYATSLNNLGALYSSMGNYAQAERHYLEALSIREKTIGKDHPSYAGSLNSLGLLYDNMGDYARAERYYLEALSIREKALGKDHPNYAIVLINLGGLYDSMGNYVLAERYYKEGLAITEKARGKDHPNYATVLNNLGNLYVNKGDYKQAERYYLEAFSIRERVLGKDHPDYAGSVICLGALYYNMGDYAKAERYHLESLGNFEKALGKDHPNYITSLGNMYIVYLAKQEYPKAVSFKQEAYKLNTDQVNRNFSFLSEQQRNAYWDANAASFEATYSLSWHHPVPESNALNYNNALFSKGLLLRTTNAVRDSIYASGNKTLIAKFEELGSLRQQISALRQSGGNQDYIQSLERQAEALDKSLTQSSAAFREFQADLVINWQHIHDSLQANEAAIEFVSFRIYDKGWTKRTQYAALVLRRGMKAPEWIPLCEEKALAEIFGKVDNIRRPQDQARILYDENGSALYNAIWKPLEKALQGAKTVYYSPSGLLHKVSFNALPVGELRLVDVYNLNLVSSTREVVRRKTGKNQSPRSAVVYGGLLYDANEASMLKEAKAYANSSIASTRGLSFDVDTDTSDYQQKTSGVSSWSYLQFTDIESKNIHQLLTAKRVPVNLYNGAKGNKESFKALSGKKTMVIHLATHGFFNQDIEKDYEEQERMQQRGGGQKVFENPLRRSGLILSGANTWKKNPVEGAENGILLADDIAGLNLLGAELIVMSACETALGEVNNSEGVFGLQRAFKLAGAETLIMSLWQVDDKATSILMEQFYTSWMSGKSKQESFKEAQRKVRAEFKSPFFWAAFVLMD